MLAGPHISAPLPTSPHTSNSGECWQAPRDLGNFLSTQTEESCTQYNVLQTFAPPDLSELSRTLLATAVQVLKISRHRMLWRAEAAEADYYERALWNGILGNQKRVAGAPNERRLAPALLFLPQRLASHRRGHTSRLGSPRLAFLAPGALVS